MATFRKVGKRWRAEVRYRGVYKSATRATKRAVMQWASDTEAAIESGLSGLAADKSLRAALEKYADEVSPGHKGERWERLRLAKMEREMSFIDELIGSVTTANLAEWRDERLNVVSAGTVRREMNLLSSVFELARREWQWISENPLKDVRKPPAPKHRDRRVSDDEVDRILLALNYERGAVPGNSSQLVAVAFLLAIETAMRAGELAGLLWADVFLKDQFVRLSDTKNKDSREVPLSKAAVKLFKLLEKRKDGAVVFGITSETISTLFRRARINAEIDGLTFHDSRHEALTQLARKLDVLDLARMVGHRDPRSLMIYYNPTASEIAARLD